MVNTLLAGKRFQSSALWGSEQALIRGKLSPFLRECQVNCQA
jgi:hypothetical protein